MEFREILNNLESLLIDAKVGILTTIDEGGYPRSRWMTPTFLPRFSGRLYTVTCPQFDKVRQIGAHPKVEWSFQSRNLERVITLTGEALIVDEPGFKVEVLEAIGPNLQVFWRVNSKARDMVVIETTIEHITLFLPLKQETYSAEAPHER